MPQDRLIHPRLGHSQKVTLLTDLEYRVWTQYMLSADDFGVMRASAVTLQADNDALQVRPSKVVQRALEHIVEVHLIEPFSHQGQPYVFQRDWQRWQKVEWPRGTNHPKPAPDQLATLTNADEITTRELFDRHPGGDRRMRPKGSLGGLGRVQGSVQDARSDHLPTSRARAPAVRQTANANGSERESEGKQPDADQDALDLRAGRFCERYSELFATYRHGARYYARPAHDFGHACELVRVWDDERLEKLVVVFLRSDDPFIEQSTRSIGVFASRASWCDDKLRQWEASHGEDIA
jgi:hypothetical protein